MGHRVYERVQDFLHCDNLPPSLPPVLPFVRVSGVTFEQKTRVGDGYSLVKKRITLSVIEGDEGWALFGHIKMGNNKLNYLNLEEGRDVIFLKDKTRATVSVVVRLSSSDVVLNYQKEVPSRLGIRLSSGKV